METQFQDTWKPKAAKASTASQVWTEIAGDGMTREAFGAARRTRWRHEDAHEYMALTAQTMR